MNGSVLMRFINDNGNANVNEAELLKMKNRSHTYCIIYLGHIFNINGTRPRHGHKYTK